MEPIFCGARRLREAWARDTATRRDGRLIALATIVLISGAIVIEMLQRARGQPDAAYRLLRLGADHGVVEVFGYGLAATTAIALWRCHRRHGGGAFRALTALFAFILIDDALLYHELAGHALEVVLELPAAPGLRARDTGEILAWALAAAALAPLLVGAAARRREGEEWLLAVFGVLLAALVVCGVLLDMASIYAGGDVGRRLGWLEDGGETIVLAAAAVAALLCLRSERAVFLRPRAASTTRSRGAPAHRDGSTIAAVSGKPKRTGPPPGDSASR